MARSVEQYLSLLQSLFPEGRFWDMVRDTNSTMYKLLYGLAAEYNRVEERMEDLVVERNSLTVTELLTEFEDEFGIPKEGSELALTTEGRREEINANLIAVGQQNKEYFIDIADALGWTVTTVEEFTPFFCDVGVCGDACGDNYNLFYWKVWVDIIVGMDWNITRLISEIEKVKPAHTIVLFDFRGAEYDRGFSRDFDSIKHYDGSWHTYFSFDANFSNAFENNTDYDGVNYTGAFDYSFSIAYDRNSGGGFFADEFGDGFSKPH